MVFWRARGMVGGEYGDEGLGEEGDDVEGVDGIAVAEDTGVEGSVLEAVDDLCGEGLVQMEGDEGEGLGVGAEDGGECGEHAGADKAHVERADLAAADAAGFFEVALDVAEGAAGGLQEGFACSRQRDGAGGSGEEGVAEDLFELADLLGERGLGEVEAEGGSAEVQFLGDGDEVAEMAEFYVLIHTYYITNLEEQYIGRLARRGGDLSQVGGDRHAPGTGDGRNGRDYDSGAWAWGRWDGVSGFERGVDYEAVHAGGSGS